MRRIVVVLACLYAGFTGSPASASAGALKVFLLAGQSNMEGQSYTYDSAATAGWNIEVLTALAPYRMEEIEALMAQPRAFDALP